MGIHLKQRIFIIVTLAFLCSNFIIGQEVTDNNKTKKVDLKIRSNSRENNPERQDNLHQNIHRPESKVHGQHSNIKDDRQIKPNRKAILNKKSRAHHNHRAMHNRISRK